MASPANRVVRPIGPWFVAGALVLIAIGALLWVRFGTLVYFDTIAAAFVGCFI
ncbi:MAG TPA: hypothetical protein VG894_10030 [Bauldia sp.]|nr:hypothetical protein [Bauldia sp.]